MKEQKLISLLELGDGIKVIAITGGPCSGKTTGLALLQERLTARGYKVLISPESATKLILAGMTPGELPWIEFQEEIILDTLAQENRLFSLAMRYRAMGKKVVILCDRGVMDGEAYVGPEAFGKLIQKLGFTHQILCARYHAAVHLRTAALGAEKFYTLANNVARMETAEEARILDQKTLDAWTMHEHPRVISNESDDFGGKLNRLFAEICAILGDPVPLEKEDKFLIESLDPSSIPTTWRESWIIQDYLVTTNAKEERRVRARGDGQSFTYYYTTKTPVSAGVRVETEKTITKGEYEALLTLRNPEMKTIRKRRICFFYEGQFFEVDLFEEPLKGLALMEAERNDLAPELKLPPFTKVIRKVTDEKQYSNAEIARGSLNTKA